MKRLTPDQIKPGRSYRLIPRYSYIPGLRLIRRVEAIRDGNVIVNVKGKEVVMPVRDFAALAVEDVTDNAHHHPQI
jgi:hypothetical protein